MTTPSTVDAATFAVATSRIEHAVVMVDAAIAKRWLAKNVKNRRIRQILVGRYRSDMLAGRWTFAGDPIRFNVSGHLVDGQHRLHAIAETDLTLPMLVVRGLPDEAQGVMDQGGRRTPGDQLGLKGVKDANAVAAAVKQYLVWTEGLLFRDRKAITTQITTPRIEAWVDENPALIANLSQVIGLTKQNDAPPSIAAAAALRFMQIDAAGCTEFFTLLARGAGTEGHPIVTLDKRLQRVRREGLKMPDRDYLSLFILAWNAWRDDRVMAKFQRPRGGRWTEDNYPVPH